MLPRGASPKSLLTLQCPADRRLDLCADFIKALSLNPQSAHVTPLLNLALQASIDLLGPIKAISSLPSFQAPQASWSQQQQSNGSRAGDRSTADDDPSRSYSQSFAAAGQHSSTMHGGGMTEDGSTMEIEDSMM